MANVPPDDSHPGLSVEPVSGIDWDTEAQKLLDSEGGAPPPTAPVVPGQIGASLEEKLGPFVLSLQALADAKADFAGRMLPQRGGRGRPTGRGPDDPFAPLQPEPEPAAPPKSAIEASMEEDEDDIEPWVFTFEGDRSADVDAAPADASADDVDAPAATMSEDEADDAIAAALADDTMAVDVHGDSGAAVADPVEAVLEATGPTADADAAVDEPEPVAWEPPADDTEAAISAITAVDALTDHELDFGSLTQLADLTSNPLEIVTPDPDLDGDGDADGDDGDDDDGGLELSLPDDIPDGDGDGGGGAAADTSVEDRAVRLAALAELRDLGL